MKNVGNHALMFITEKKSRGHSYLYLVRSVREGAKVRQEILQPLGRKDKLLESGQLDRLYKSFAQHSDRLEALKLMEAESVNCQRIGAPMLFERLWKETGCQKVLTHLLGSRAFEGDMERAIFITVLHRIMAQGSDRACHHWMQSYDIPGASTLALHHFYRAMAWLGEHLPETDQIHATPFSPRRVKDTIEENLFSHRRDLFSELSLVFMDTTSLSFHGAGGTMGARGFSKDHRPDLNQMVLAVIIDQNGYPICCEMWPGNTADVTSLLPVVDRLRGRFGVERVVVVADRGMISEATIAGLEKRNIEYILGVRERTDSRVRTHVLKDTAPLRPFVVHRKKGQTQLFGKEVRHAGIRYIICRNEAQAEKDRADRQAILKGLERQLEQGDKALVGNSAYRRYLRKPGGRSKGPAFEIDLGKLAEESQYDGLFVLRTNANVTPEQAVTNYRNLLVVEQLFRNVKVTLETRPIYHSSDAAICGHVFCSFLAFVLVKELRERCERIGIEPEWDRLVRDLDQLQIANVSLKGQLLKVRTSPKGDVGRVFQAAGVALPKTIETIEA